MKSIGEQTILLLGFLCLFGIATSHISANDRDKLRDSEVIDRIKETVENIYDHLKKKEDFKDVKDLLQIDATLKRLEEQTKEITTKLSSDLGRSGVSSNEIQLIENKLDSMETQLVSNVKGSIRKMDEVERQTTTLKTEMGQKLGKMMNIMNSVHEMSNKFANSIAKPTSSDVRAPSSSKSDEKMDEMNRFFEEQFESLGQKIEETVQIMKRELKKDLAALENSIANNYESCEDFKTNMEEVKQTCGSGGSGGGGSVSPEMLSKITETVVKNLTRTQREVNEKFENKLKDLETKMEQKTGGGRSQESARERPNNNNKNLPGRSFKEPEVVSSGNLQVTSAKAKPNEIDKVVVVQPKQCVTPSTNKTPKNCWELHKLGANCDGIYIIYPEKRRATYAFCDMTDDGGGWTVLMRRGDFGPRKENFDRNWVEYREGFGDKQGEFWLGLENIHQLSHQLEVVLRVTLEDFEGGKTFFDYDPFSVASESMNYRLHVGKITEQAKNYMGYSLRHHNMKPFSTFDKNNDHRSINNAAKFRGGWWYNMGHYALLTAPYIKPSDTRQKWEGMQWHAWKGNNLIKSAEMKIRPKYHNV